MTTIDTSSSFFVHCNRCHAETYHESRGECKATANHFDEASRIDIYFADTYSLLQCLVCGHGRLQLTIWNSENDSSPPILFPPSEFRRPPEWLNDLEQTHQFLLKEIYAALDAGMYAIALMGVRAVLDVWVTNQSSGGNYFPKKLAPLVTRGTLSANQVEILVTVFDAGSAAAHRGYVPSQLDAFAAIEAVENLLHQHVLAPKIVAMKGNTPQREDR